MASFKEGDIVQLKSGGPKMTFSGKMRGDSLHCQWFAGSKLEFGFFMPAMLIGVSEKKAKEE